MKTLVSLILMASVLFGMGADTVESLHICKSKAETYLVTISTNETEGRAIWIDHYELLVGGLPITFDTSARQKLFQNCC